MKQKRMTQKEAREKLNRLRLAGELMKAVRHFFLA